MTFKKGDRVCYNCATHEYSCGKIQRGGIYTVSTVEKVSWGQIITLKEFGDFTWSGCNFTLEEQDTSKHHKHHDLIIAWAKGAKIESRPFGNGAWGSPRPPQWLDHYEYRIKPEPKPDIVSNIMVVRPIPVGSLCSDGKHYDEVKCTYDGETGKLKAVELIK